MNCFFSWDAKSCCHEHYKVPIYLLSSHSGYLLSWNPCLFIPSLCIQRQKTKKVGALFSYPKELRAVWVKHWFPRAVMREICTNGVWQQKPFAKTPLQWRGGGAATFRVVWSGYAGDFGGSAFLGLASVKGAGPAVTPYKDWLYLQACLWPLLDMAWQRVPLPAPVRADGGPGFPCCFMGANCSLEKPQVLLCSSPLGRGDVLMMDMRYRCS